MVSLNIWKHLWKHCHSQIMTYSSPSEISLGPLSFFAIQKAVHNECINRINLEEFSPSLLKVNTSGWELQVGVLFFFEGFAPLSFCLHGFWWEVCCNSYPCSSVEKVFFPSGCNSRFSLHLSFSTTCVDVYLLVFILIGIFWTFWVCDLISVINFGKFLAILASNIFSALFTSSSGIPIMHML